MIIPFKLGNSGKIHCDKVKNEEMYEYTDIGKGPSINVVNGHKIIFAFLGWNFIIGLKFYSEGSIW